MRCACACPRSEGGATLVDAGIAVPGGLEAGRRIAEICMGGLGTVTLVPGDATVAACTQVHVHSADPVLACLASQYAGWSLSHGEGKGAFRALASGPGRAIARRETLFDELGYADRFERARSSCWRSTASRPRRSSRRWRATAIFRPSGSRFILTPTRSLAGTVQIVARVLEVALHKAHALGLSARAHRRRRRCRAAAAARRRFPHRDGPHQRRDPVRRQRDAVRGRVGRPGAPARRHASRVGLARLRQAVRADLQGFRIRLLPDRSDAVRAGRGAGVQPRLRARASAAARATARAWRSRSGCEPRTARRHPDRRAGLARAAPGAARSPRSGPRPASRRCRDCRVDLEANRWGIVMPGFEAQLPGWRVRARDRQGQLRAGDVAPGPAARAGGVAGAGLQQRPRDRADGGQIDDLHAAAPGGHRHTGDLGDRARVAGARHADARDRTRPSAGAEAAVRVAGQGPAAARARRRPAAGAEYGGVYYLQRFVESRAARPATTGCS